MSFPRPAVYVLFRGVPWKERVTGGGPTCFAPCSSTRSTSWTKTEGSPSMCTTSYLIDWIWFVVFRPNFSTIINLSLCRNAPIARAPAEGWASSAATRCAGCPSTPPVAWCAAPGSRSAKDQTLPTFLPRAPTTPLAPQRWPTVSSNDLPLEKS